jgi:valyl-tRNA synthetase
MPLPERYDPNESEAKWRAFWHENNLYAFRDGQPAFTIDTPPPTVSGSMHMGHAFSYTQGDFIARYKRMRGYNVLYPFGTDDNGLPTEKLVEKEKKVNSTKMPRKDFRELCLQTVHELLPEFQQAWIDIGMSADFREAYSTIDEESQAISQRSFLDLYEKGYIHRKEDPFAWCVQCQTAIAQAEFENVELTSALSEIKFTITTKDGGSETGVIMTSRPELLPACVALCYHPEDDRHASRSGATATVPLFGHSVPVLADPSVDRTKGTGLMMVCTFGDKEDIEKWRRHELPLRTLFTKDGKLGELGGEFAGMPVREARKAVLKALEDEGVLVSTKQVKHAVNTHERCGTEIEFLKTAQWFINVLEHKQELLDAGRAINWYPEHMLARYEHWVENLGWDWAISRQRSYGVPFPVWHSKRAGEEGKILFAHPEDLPVDPLTDVPRGYTAEDVEPETDVMDTWATSSCTPDIVLGWNTERSKEYHPMSLRLQAHDIIRTWAFYTIVKSIYSHGRIPWKDIVISGHGLDSKGKKMSKSKGNGVDPVEFMRANSADILRWWASGSKLGDDLRWQEKDIQTAKRTVNKLFNAARFTIGAVENHDQADVPLELLDKWLLAHLAVAIDEATAHFEKYEYSKARAAIDQFFWSTYCDHYLELVKSRIYNVDREPAGKTAAQQTLHSAMLAVVKLFAPFIPHVTEEIYQGYFREHDGAQSIHLARWPESHEEWRDVAALQAGDVLVTILGGVRKFRSEQQLGMKTPLAKLTICCPTDVRKKIEDGILDLQGAANVTVIEWIETAGLSWEIQQ